MLPSLKKTLLAAIGTAAALGCLISISRAETHWDFQAIDTNGVSTWAGSYPVTLTGVILNHPETMLDATWDPNAVANGVMGGQWQIFIQGTNGDHQGTALWMGQNYNSLGGWIPAGNFYTESGWSNEMVRLNYDGGHQFRQGDLVTVTVNKSSFYGGKLNVSEAHRVTNANDFSIALVTANFGLPSAPSLTLSDLYAATNGAGYDPAYPMFDASRATGAEFYQGASIRLNGLTLVDTNGWGQSAWGDRLCWVTDGLGHTNALRMPLADLGAPPAGVFDVYGIVNQESGSGSNGRMGYELFVVSVIPEPSVMVLLGVGALVAVGWRRRK
ncbi:MAG: PEP-CTERM sorting domain-containing protein [Verrucomicrobiae bacterium]|nr:PEP-CTERM sorting domain-containing protein [Verrucomicrobiae bacterium]